MKFGVEYWITDEEKGLLNVPFPILDLNAACYAVYLVSRLRKCRAPERFENMMILAAGNNWAKQYVDEFVRRVRPPKEICVCKGGIVWEEVRL